MADWHIGVIGGSGLYNPGTLEDSQEIAVSSAFGEPSGPVTTGRIGDMRFTFIARHGEGHRFSPSHVNYRANIDVLKRCGVTDVVAISAIGSLQEKMAPGEFVLVDQLIDRTAGRERSFFGDGIVAHVPLADPVCSRLSSYVGKRPRQLEPSCMVRAHMSRLKGRSFRPEPKAISIASGALM